MALWVLREGWAHFIFLARASAFLILNFVLTLNVNWPIPMKRILAQERLEADQTQFELATGRAEITIWSRIKITKEQFWSCNSVR